MEVIPVSDLTAEQYYQNPNNKAKSSYLSGWRRRDGWVLVITVLSSVAGWIAVNADRLHWGWALLITFSLLFNAHVEYERLYEELQKLLAGAYISIFLNDILWEAEPTGNRLQRFLRDRRYLRDGDRRAPIPLAHHFVEALVEMEDGQMVRERYGVLDELDTDGGYMGIRVDGSAYGDQDFRDQQRIHADMSRALNAFFGTADRRVGVTELRLVRPADLTVIDKTIAESGDPFMFYPDGLPADIDPLQRKFDLNEGSQRWAEFRSKNFALLKPTARRAAATRPWMVFIISFKWKRVASRAIKGGLDDEQINDMPLIELGKMLNEELRAVPGLELQNPHVMSPIELAEFTRCALIPDVPSTDRYYEDKVLGRFVSNEDDLEVVTAETVKQYPDRFKKSDIGTILTELPAWPKKRIVVKGDRILIDDTWFMMLRFTQTPEVEHPTRAQQVHFATPPGEWSGHAEVSERTSGTIDTNMLMAKETAVRSFEEHRNRRRLIVNPNVRRRQRRAQLGLEQVSLESTNQRYLPISHITAPFDKPKLLNRRFKKYRTDMKNQGIKVSKVRGRARQLAALITAVLGVNRL